MKNIDYLIIGAGSAGCVLANRLSEDANNNVLVLEAGGPDNDINIHIPGGYTKLFKTKLDWGFWTETQEHILNRKIYLPRAKMLGGCSSNNAMAYVRGNRKDYDDWAAMGNDGWDYQSILHYFIKSEGNENADELDKGYHGSDGGLKVSFASGFITPYSSAFIQACANNGIPTTADYNGKKQTGASLCQMTIKNGKRQSGAVAFLKSALKRPNLNAITKARVTRILFENKKAVGVEYVDKRNKKQYIHVNKEIILSAGAFQSPQILMLSGVGDAAELKEVGIDCVHELKGVGKNLQDHLMCSVSAKAKQQKGLNHYIPLWKQLLEFPNYLFNKKGPFSIGPLEAMAFTDLTGKNESANFQFHFTPMYTGKGYNYDMYDANTFPTNDGFTILPTLLHPKSRGFVKLKSKDPLADPIIQPNFLEKKEDLDQLVKGVKKALKIINDSAFDDYREEIVAPPDTTTDERIIHHIKSSVETVYHPVGTCKMGNDDMAVVDSELRVHGVTNLRVVDASIMPKIVSGNTNAPTFMIAEKAADMILGKEYKKSKAMSLNN